jgi:hypothetical protein
MNMMTIEGHPMIFKDADQKSEEERLGININQSNDTTTF